MPLFEDDTLEGAIRKATAGLGRQRKSEEALPMHRGFGPYPDGSRIPGTSGSNISSFDEARDRVFREFERLAHDHFPAQARMYDSNVFTQIIPELSAFIRAQSNGSGELTYSYPNLRAGKVSRRTGDGEVDLEADELTVAVLHAHWINTTPSPDEISGGREITNQPGTDRYAAERIRELFGRNIRFYVYKWNGAYREF